MHKVPPGPTSAAAAEIDRGMPGHPAPEHQLLLGQERYWHHIEQGGDLGAGENSTRGGMELAPENDIPGRNKGHLDHEAGRVCEFLGQTSEARPSFICGQLHARGKGRDVVQCSRVIRVAFGFFRWFFRFL